MTNYNSSLYISIKHTIRNRQFQIKTQLTVPTGITVLCGHSGAGKSTLLNIIAGIIVPDEGYISLNDTVWFDSKKNICIPTHQRNIGYVFQTSALFPHLNCLNNVVYGIPKTTPKQQRIDHAMALLKQMNADHVAHQKPATLSGEEIYPPLHIQSTNKLSHIDYTLPVASAQVKSALLFASLYAQQDSLIVEPILSRDHTERMLCYLGAPVLFQKTPGTIVMQVSSWNRELLPKPISIPGDISSAAFIIAAAVITQSSVTISNVGLNPLRKCFLDALRKSGACIEEEIVSQENMEPRGNIVVHQNKNRQPFVLNRQEVASCIDEIPILAIVAACSSGESQFYGVEDLEFKESNRIKTIQDMLSSFSVSSKYHDGILSIDGIGEQLFSKATIQTQGDHRIVMAAAIASLRANGVCTITHADSVDTSFPSFALTLQKLGVEIQAH